MTTLDLVLDAAAANQAQARAIYNPDTPEDDSLVEAIIAEPGLSPEFRKRLLVFAQDIAVHNKAEALCELRAARLLDAQTPRTVRDTIGVHGAARVLRQAFSADRRGDEFAVQRTVHRLLGDPRCGERVLRAKSLAGQLGCEQYARVIALLDREQVPA